MKVQCKNLFFIFLFLALYLADDAKGQCGDGNIDAGETCDPGLNFLGSYYNSVCCSNNCTAYPSGIYNMVICNSDADCNDGNPNTVDTCPGSTKRCKHNIVTATFPCSGTSMVGCPTAPCMNLNSCTSSTCRYTVRTSGSGTSFTTLFGNTHCQNETLCAHSFERRTVGAHTGLETYISPSPSITEAGPSTISCNANVSFSTIYTTPVTGNFDPNTVGPYGEPNMTLSVTDGGNGVTHCSHTLYVTQTGPLTGYLRWGPPYKYGFDNQCTLVVTATSSCPAPDTNTDSFTKVYTAPSLFVGGFECDPNPPLTIDFFGSAANGYA